jgi:hypothetical protein
MVGYTLDPIVFSDALASMGDVWRVMISKIPENNATGYHPAGSSLSKFKPVVSNTNFMAASLAAGFVSRSAHANVTNLPLISIAIAPSPCLAWSYLLDMVFIGILRFFINAKPTNP